MRYVLLGFLVLAGCASKPEVSGYRVPDGFVVEEAAGAEGLGALTFDALGRPVAVRGGREVVIFSDKNGDGRYENESVFTAAAGTVRGLFWEGRTLYAAGDEGIYECADRDADDVADGCWRVSEEKGALAVRRGADGAVIVLWRDRMARWDRKTGQMESLGGGVAEADGFGVHPEGEVFGRAAGSRGALEFYASEVYPGPYRGAMFSVKRGRVMVSKAVKCGGAWCAESDSEFASGGTVEDLAVGPDGCLWFTAGRLYRVAYRPGVLQQMYAGRGPGAHAARQGQPLSSWGHAQLLAAKALAGEKAWKRQLWELALDRSVKETERAGALLILDRTGPRATAELLRPLAQDPSGTVRAAAVLVASFHGSARAKAIVAGGLNDTDPFVRRRALEGLARMGLNAENFESFAPVNIVYEGLNDPDRAVRRAARAALERYPRRTWEALALGEKSGRAGAEACLALTRTAGTEQELDAVLEMEQKLLRGELTGEQRRDVLRVVELTKERRAAGPRRGL